MANCANLTIPVNVPSDTFVVSALKMKYRHVSQRDLTMQDCRFTIPAIQHMVQEGTTVILNGEAVTLLNPIPVQQVAPVALPAAQVAPPAAQVAPLAAQVAPLAAQVAPPVGQVNPPVGQVNPHVQNGNVNINDNTWIMRIPNGTVIGSGDEFEPKTLLADFRVVLIPGTNIELNAGQRVRMEHGGQPIYVNLEASTIVQIP